MLCYSVVLLSARKAVFTMRSECACCGTALWLFQQHIHIVFVVLLLSAHSQTPFTLCLLCYCSLLNHKPCSHCVFCVTTLIPKAHCLCCYCSLITHIVFVVSLLSAPSHCLCCVTAPCSLTLSWLCYCSLLTHIVFVVLLLSAHSHCRCCVTAGL